MTFKRLAVLVTAVSLLAGFGLATSAQAMTCGAAPVAMVTALP